MAFLDEVKRSLTTTGMQVAKKTKEITDTVQLKAKIAAENETENRIFEAIGKRVFEENEEADRIRFADAFASLKESVEKKEELEAQLAQMDKKPVCESCGAKLPKGAVFCSRCGARVEPEEMKEEAGEQEAEAETGIVEAEVETGVEEGKEEIVAEEIKEESEAGKAKEEIEEK